MFGNALIQMSQIVHVCTQNLTELNLLLTIFFELSIQ